MNNLSPIPKRFVAVVPGVFTVLAGAAGFVDTDVSATTGTNQGRLWLVTHVVAGFATQDAGVRANGSAVDHRCAQAMGTWLTYVSATGHADLYRAAADNVYTFKGYFE